MGLKSKTDIVKKQTPEYQQLLGNISTAYTNGQVRAVQAVNTFLLETYWEIGRHIVEFEQGGNVKAEYGKALLKNLSKDLTLLHGKGFSRSNLVYMRLLYLRYPIGQKPSHQLSWSHFVELLKIDNELERSFYEKQSMIEKWSVPELKRQKEAALFERLALSQDKKGVFQLAEKGRQTIEPQDILREPSKRRLQTN